MEKKPVLTPQYCLAVVISSTPNPSVYDPATDKPSTTTLFDLGVVDAQTSAMYIHAVKSRIFPWHIDDNDVVSSSATTLQQSADSVQNNAF